MDRRLSMYVLFACVIFLYTNVKLQMKQDIQEKRIAEIKDIVRKYSTEEERKSIEIIIQNKENPPIEEDDQIKSQEDEDDAVELKPNIVQIQKLEMCETTLKFKCEKRHSGFKLNVSTEVLEHSQILKENPDIAFGGSWKPSYCVSNSRIALIVPYRGRETHLKLMLRNVIPFLKAQNKSFTIFVVEQVGPDVFNKGQLMNAGFIESQKLGRYDCFIFHDVDMVPLNLCNFYECPDTGMRHLGLSRDLENPHMVYNKCIGGASAFPRRIFSEINGYTNVMFGWGGEDDDGFFRLRESNISVHRYNVHIGNYLTFKHGNDTLNPKSLRKYDDASFHFKYKNYDGLNSVYYRVTDIFKESLLTRILVHIPGPRSASSLRLFFSAKVREFKSLLYEEMNRTTTAKSSKQIDKKT